MKKKRTYEPPSMEVIEMERPNCLLSESNTTIENAKRNGFDEDWE